MKNLLLGLMTLATISNMALANDDLRLGEPGYGGSGCPAGSASATVSPDGKALSIIFDEYIVEAGGSVGKSLDRKNCSIAIPVHVPQGFSVSIIDIDYRGFNSLPRGAMSRFSAEYFFAGMRGPRVQKDFRGGLDEDYIISNKLGLNATVWSKCGADVNLRINSSLMVRNTSRKMEALTTVDSADINGGLVYHLAWKRCNAAQDDDFFDGVF